MMVEVLSSSVHVVYIFLFSEEWVPVSQQLTGVSHRSLLPAAYKSKLYYQTILNVTCVKMVSAQTKFIVIPQMHMSFLSLSRGGTHCGADALTTIPLCLRQGTILNI